MANIFFVLCWFIGKTKNESNFSSSHRNSQAVVNMGYLWARSYHEFDGKMKSFNNKNMLIGWNPPALGWIELKSDRVVSLDGQRAAIGGIL